MSSYPLSIANVHFLNRVAALSIAAKVMSLIEVKLFSFEEWILENRLIDWQLPVMTQASVT